MSRRSRRWWVGVIVTCCATGLAHADLTAERRYAPKGRPMLVRAGGGTVREIVLYRGRMPAAPGGPEFTAIDRAAAPVGDGAFDLTAVFPLLKLDGAKSVLLAQGVGEGGPAGAPIVLEPLLAPERAIPGDPKGLTIKFQPAAPAYDAGWRVYALDDVVLETSLGTIRIGLRPEAAPRTAWHFRGLVGDGFYDGLTFHRVVGPSDAARPGSPESEGFVIQGGDPLGTGAGGPGFAIALERSTLEHGFGTVSLARLAAPDSGGSQFFICLSRRNGRALDGAYAAFGQVLDGAEVVRAISRVPVAAGDRPVEAVVIKTARLVPARPIGAETPAAPAPDPAEPPPRER